MEVKNIIVYFPWGAGGNLLQNILSLAPGYQMISHTGDDVDDKESFLLDYYGKDITPETWLKREWSIRGYYSNRYYNFEVPGYWNPEFNLVYATHGENRMIGKLSDNRLLEHWDRYNVEQGNIPEQHCPETTHNLTHIFLIPDDYQLTANIYQSKNPDLSQLKEVTDPHLRKMEALQSIITQCKNLYKLEKKLSELGKNVFHLRAEDLLTSSGVDSIMNLITKLGLDINASTVRQVHTLWLDSTRECFRTTHNRELN